MYGKVFASLFNGSMRGQSDLQLVFINMLATCDEDGAVDKVPQAIADETGLPLPRVETAIALLEGPDPMSRTPDNEGRRIRRVLPERSWGWLILNYATYRAIATKQHRKKYMRGYMRDYRDGDEKLAADVYAKYPRKVGRPGALRAITRAMTLHGQEVVSAATEKYAVAVKGMDPKFIPHPATWYNQERYNDDPATWNTAPHKKKKESVI